MQDEKPLQGLAIITPVLNDAQALQNNLPALQLLRQRGALLCITDGGSSDNSLAAAEGLADLVISAPRGRARQMNSGAEATLRLVQTQQLELNALLFLHCDTCLPDDLVEQLAVFHSAEQLWGFFPLRLDVRGWRFGLIGRMISWRSRLTSVGTGDQAFLVKPALWQRLRGFRDLDLMEDLDFSYRCKQQKLRPWLASSPVVTSARRWQQRGVVRTVLLMWCLRSAFYLGVDARHLAKLYR